MEVHVKRLVAHSRSLTLIALVGVLAPGMLLQAQGLDLPDRASVVEQLEKASTAGDLEAMAEHAETIAVIELVEYFEASYELIRIHCKRGDENAAFEVVQDMLDAGYWDYRRLLGDEELTLINQTDRLRGMIRAAWAKGYISMLERDSRDAMQHPDRIMKALDIKAGDVVADIGAGSGYFTVRLAGAVGDQGRVIATDIRQEMLDFIEGRLEQAAISNVELVKVGPEETGLPTGAVDTVLMVDVMHYIKDRSAYAAKLRAALAPGGRVVVIDFRHDPEAKREFAPKPEDQVPRAVLDKEMAEAGLRVSEEFDFLPEQYFVVYTPTE